MSKIFRGQTDTAGEPSIDFQGIHNACKQLDSFEIEVRKPTNNKIDKMRRWLFCENGPVEILKAKGYDSQEAQQLLKLWHPDLFDLSITSENFNDTAKRGDCYFRCKFCKKLIQIHKIVKDGNKRFCPHCNNEARLMVLRSVSDLNAKEFLDWMEVMINKGQTENLNIQPPDPDYYKVRQ